MNKTAWVISETAGIVIGDITVVVPEDWNVTVTDETNSQPEGFEVCVIIVVN